jgi:Ca2+-binding EF-hand superfamily protein
MFQYGKFCIAFLVALAGLMGAASTQTSAWNDGLDWLAPRVVVSATAGAKVDSVKAKAQMLFINSDLSGKGVSQADYELTEQLYFAGQRQQRVSQWTRYDLDGDGKVTRAEIERARRSEAIRSLRPHGITITPTPEQIATVLDKLVGQVLADDLDGDGIVTLEEVLEAHRRHMGKQPPPAMTMHLVPLSLDRDGDGIVSRQEFDAAVDEVIARIDTNGDGVVSEEELNAARVWANAANVAFHTNREARREAGVARNLATTCAFPKPPADAKVILVGAYEGRPCRVSHSVTTTT